MMNNKIFHDLNFDMFVVMKQYLNLSIVFFIDFEIKNFYQIFMRCFIMRCIKFIRRVVKTNAICVMNKNMSFRKIEKFFFNVHVNETIKLKYYFQFIQSI